MSQQSVIHFDANASYKPVQKIIGGYVEFSILEETRVHYFTQADDLGQLEYYVSVDKSSAGIKQFIKEHYTPENFSKEAVSDDDITIWNHEIEFA